MSGLRLEPERDAIRLPIILTLIVGGMAATTNTSVTGLLLTSIADDLDRSVALMGSLRAISATVAFVTAFPLSRYADQYPRKYLILLGLGFMLVSGLFALTAPNLTIFLGYYVFAGMADVILFAMLLAAASDYVGGAALDRANGFVIGAFGIPGIVIVPLAGIISDNAGWRQAYLVNTAIALIGAILVLLLLPRIEPSAARPESMLSHLRMMTRKPGLMTIILGNVMRFTILTALIAYTAAFLIETYDLSDGRAGFYYGIGSVVFLSAAFSSGLLINRLGLRRVMLPGGMILTGALIVAFLPGNPGLVTGIGLILSGSLLSIQENGALGAILRIAPDDRGAATSLNEIGAAVSGVIGATFGGLVIGIYGFNGLSVFLGAVGLLALYFTWRSFRTVPAATTTAPEASTVHLNCIPKRTWKEPDMSGLIDKIKSMFSPDRADQVADQVEKNVTDERVDQAVNRVPGGDRVADKVPDNVGDKAADAIRDAGGATDDTTKDPQN